MERKITIEEARKTIEEYPEDEHYISEHYSQGLGWHNEHWDNTIETHAFWHRCKRMVDAENSPEKDQETGMYVYPKNVDPKKIPSNFWPKIKIVVDSEESKEQMLKAIEYIHCLECIDPNFMPVNSLMHLYLFPDSVEVKSDYDFDLGEQR